TRPRLGDSSQFHCHGVTLVMSYPSWLQLPNHSPTASAHGRLWHRAESWSKRQALVCSWGLSGHKDAASARLFLGPPLTHGGSGGGRACAAPPCPLSIIE